ncbi:MAG: dihydrofolate reductase family protein [Lapillicoccus sp.]
MARLLYTAIASLDGYTVDADGDFSWAAPDHEVHLAVNDLLRGVGIYLYGRRIYEVMTAWETMGDDEDDQPAIRDFARVWRGADKVVYSSTLDPATFAGTAGPRTRLEQAFDPQTVRALVRDAEADVAIGGPTLAAHALRAELVDDLQLFLVPVVVGGGTAFLPDGVRLGLRLLEERRFASGVVFLRYAVGS